MLSEPGIIIRNTVRKNATGAFAERIVRSPAFVERLFSFLLIREAWVYSSKHSPTHPFTHFLRR
jgi:hypothetical protein